MNNLFSRMLQIYRTLRTAHGLYVKPPFVFMAILGLRVFVGACMALDYLLFPRLWKAKVQRPIVLVGNPRTGTTFLQRFLSKEGFGSGMELFLMLYPSLILQKLLRPLLPVLERVSPARHHSSAAHQTSLDSVETDDVGVLFRYLDGFFLWAFFLSFDEKDMVPAVDPKLRDTSARDFAWLETLWRRSLVQHRASRNIAKVFSLGPRMPQFLEAFPDAQILYMVRDPVSVIPSTMSLVTGPLDSAFGFWAKPEAVRNQWFERMYQGLLLLLRRFHDDWVSGNIDKSRVYVVRYDRMMGNFEDLMQEICEFLGHPMTPELAATIQDKAQKQRSFKSEHQYDLSKFNLSEERIRRDCAFFYETFMPRNTRRCGLVGP
jgi:hypothetical protein